MKARVSRLGLSFLLLVTALFAACVGTSSCEARTLSEVALRLKDFPPEAGLQRAESTPLRSRDFVEGYPESLRDRASLVVRAMRDGRRNRLEGLRPPGHWGTNVAVDTIVLRMTSAAAATSALDQMSEVNRMPRAEHDGDRYEALRGSSYVMMMRQHDLVIEAVASGGFDVARRAREIVPLLQCRAKDFARRG